MTAAGRDADGDTGRSTERAAGRGAPATAVGGPELGDPHEIGGLILLPWRRMPFPVPWSDVFSSRRQPPHPSPELGAVRARSELRPLDASSGSRPLHLEVGFGDGRFTVRRAQAEPDADYVGLEISSASIQRARARVAREGVRNVRLLKVGAGFAVRHLFGPGTLASIVVNFPDPWPKAKHVENRLLQRRFFELAATRLRPGGEIRLATDHPEYLGFAQEEARASGVFELHEAGPPAAVFETKYALKWRAHGKPLHYQVFRAAGAPSHTFPVLERPATMPHALLQGVVPTSIPFEKRVAPYGGGHVILHEVAVALPVVGESDADGPRLLVRATVDEPDIRQQLLVSVRQRAANEAIVRIESFGDPIITGAVRGAVHLTTEWLLDRTDLALQARNY